MADIESLKKNRDFKKVFARGKSVINRYLVLYYLPNNLKTCRFGFTAGKKTGNAVKRNRIKRLFREACRLNSGIFTAGYDYILVARRDISFLSCRQVEEYLRELTGKMNANKQRRG